jgi:hypothetical protein
MKNIDQSSLLKATSGQVSVPPAWENGRDEPIAVDRGSVPSLSVGDDDLSSEWMRPRQAHGKRGHGTLGVAFRLKNDPFPAP